MGQTLLCEAARRMIVERRTLLQCRKRVALQFRSILGEVACFPGLLLQLVMPVRPKKTIILFFLFFFAISIIPILAHLTPDAQRISTFDAPRISTFDAQRILNAHRTCKFRRPANFPMSYVCG